MNKTTADRPLPPELREAARGLVGVVGESRALELLGVSANAFNRGLAGLPVRRGTSAAIELGIAAAIAAATDARAREAQGGQ
jgi:hypothetical protein